MVESALRARSMSPLDFDFDDDIAWLISAKGLAVFIWPF